jgi:hypothetical protein
MEHLWSRADANPRKRRQTPPLRKPRDSLQPAACSCIRLPGTRDGKEGVDGSSPSEGFAKPPQVGAFRSGRLALCRTCGGYGAVHGGLAHATRPLTRGRGGRAPRSSATRRRIGVLHPHPAIARPGPAASSRMRQRRVAGRPPLTVHARLAAFQLIGSSAASRASSGASPTTSSATSTSAASTAT